MDRRRGFAESQTAAIKHNVIAIETIKGVTKKYLQVKIVTTKKQATSAHAGPRMSANVSRGRPPSCHAKTAENTRKAEIMNPEPI